MNIDINAGDSNIVFGSPFVATQSGQIVVTINKIMPGSVDSTRLVDFTAYVSYAPDITVTRTDEFSVSDVSDEDSLMVQCENYIKQALK